MPRSNSLPSLRAQIAKLEQKADAIKRQVVSRLQREIKAHGLTAEDLFGSAVGGGSVVGDGRKVNAGAGRSKSKPFQAKAPKYGDETGNVWGGMGKRPQWLKERLEAGASLDEFLLAGKSAPAAVARKSRGDKAAGVTAVKPASTKRNPPKTAAGNKRPAGKKVSAARKPRKAAQSRAETAES